MIRSQQIDQLRSHLARGDLEGARKLAAKLAEQHADDAVIVDACVDVLARTGEAASALQAAEGADDASEAGGQYRIGRLLRDTGQAERAIEYLTQARQAGFEPLPECLLQLALACADLRREEDAVQHLEELLGMAPSHQLGQFNLATLHQAAGRKAEAERLFRQILDRDPTFSEALIRIIYGRRMTGDDGNLVRKAEKRARSMMTPARDKEGLHYALAKAYDDLGDYPVALGKARSANEMQAKRIGRYKPAEMARLTETLIKRVTPAWLDAPVCNADFAPIFIVGHFRSGSTLVEQILSGHDAVVSLGEVDYFLRLWASDSDGFTDLHSGAQEPALKNMAESYRKLTAAMGAGAARGIDKRPENLLFMGLLRKLFPGARFVHTRRDLLDTAISVYFQQLNDLSLFGTSMVDFADYDRQCRKLMQHWQNTFGDAMHTVHYEDMVHSPEQTARSLLEFLGLEWDPRCLEFRENRNYVRTASMAQVREGIHRRSVGRGRNYLALLSADERAALTPD